MKISDFVDNLPDELFAHLWLVCVNRVNRSAFHNVNKMLLLPLPNEVELFMNNQKIQAIKIMRERTGGGLKETKDALEAAVGEMPRDVDLT